MYDKDKEMTKYLEFVDEQREILEAYYQKIVADVKQFHKDTCNAPEHGKCEMLFLSTTVTAITNDGLYNHLKTKHERLKKCSH
jgi:hypothetical protein